MSSALWNLTRVVGERPYFKTMIEKEINDLKKEVKAFELRLISKMTKEQIAAIVAENIELKQLKLKKMAKYVKTTDDSIGGMLIDGERVVTATIIDGRKVVEILKATKEQLDQILPLASQIAQDLINFFNSIFQPFPCVIKLEGRSYVLTEQRAPWAAIDRVFYMNEADKNDIIFQHEAKAMPKAKRELRKELKTYGYAK